MERSTIEKRFGPVSDKQAEEVTTLHRALVRLSRKGVKVDTEELNRVIDVASSMNKVKDVRTLESVRNALNGDTIHPVYDMFKGSGRSLVYQVFPNLSSEIPQTIFDTPENATPVALPRENPLEHIARAVCLLSKGYVPTLVVGDTLFLAPSSA